MSSLSGPPKSLLELLFAEQLKTANFPLGERNYQFALPRKFEIDFAWPQWKIGVEIEGGTFIGGAHARALGIKRDCTKQNYLILLGWRVLRGDTNMVNDGTLLEMFRLLWKSTLGTQPPKHPTQDVGAEGEPDPNPGSVPT